MSWKNCKSVIMVALPAKFPSLISSSQFFRAQLFKNWITYSLHKSSIQHSQRIPFDAFDEICAEGNDVYTFNFVLYKFHMATTSFSYISRSLDSSLSSGYRYPPLKQLGPGAFCVRVKLLSNDFGTELNWKQQIHRDSAPDTNNRVLQRVCC